ncbi:helix-turn-helix domain-containing protein [Natrinema sp. SYSU A 869]|uniref:helix-turn-helix domain-containing protein n=1 Tax=Natrinema sp. SYSU A 869 TaxID=2871694 RepID=UPI001CA390D6|nr:helix-turn-helix domain-containing protein [Natrinema sp. SYSU A 869]
MELVAEYEIICESLPLVEVAETFPEATLETMIGPDQGRHPPFITTVIHDSPERVEQAFESATFVGEYSLIDRTDQRRRYKILPSVGMEDQLGEAVDDLAALRALAHTDSIIDRIRVTPTGWVQTGRFADMETLDDFRTFWQRNGAFRLCRLTRGTDAAATDDGLTDPQFEAVRIAYEMGYFEIPRTASLEDVAAELGISASSLSERLRRAQTHLVETTIASSDRVGPGGRTPL